MRRGVPAVAVGIALTLAACGPSGAPAQDPGERAAVRLPSEPVAASATVATSVSPATTGVLTRPPSVTLPVPSTAPPTTPAPVTEAPTTAAPATAPATAAPAAPRPAPAPAPRAPVAPPPPNASEPVVVIGSIEIPKLGLGDRLYSGITMPTLDRGPGYWPGTAMPGQAGNTVIAGHRTSKSRPFRYIDRLVEGDEIVLTTDAGRFVYRVTSHEIVTPDALWILDQATEQPTVTLFACHPPGSTAYRWVTRAVLVTA